MFSYGRILELLEIYELSDNSKDYVQSPMEGRTLLSRDLIEGKVQIDRWNQFLTDWIFHTSKKDLIKSLFGVEEKDGAFTIFGANINFSDHINPNLIIGLCLNNDKTLFKNPSSNIANSIIVLSLDN